MKVDLNADLKHVYQRLAKDEEKRRVSSDGKTADSYPAVGSSILPPGPKIDER